MGFNLELWLSELTGKTGLDIPLCDVSKILPDDEREWLITNGQGSYASSSISGANTRRYHGLFVPALQPPTSRTVLFSRIDELVDGSNIAASLWESGKGDPSGCQKIVAFSFFPVPTWVYQLDNGYLIKQVVMPNGKQEMFVAYSWVAKTKGGKADLVLHLIFNNRDFHGETKAENMQQPVQEVKAKELAFTFGEQKLYLSFSEGSYSQDPHWYHKYFFKREEERGLGCHDDAFHAGTLSLALLDGQSVVVRAALEEAIALPSWKDILHDLFARQEELGSKVGAKPLLKRLAWAADKFVVRRQSTDSQSVIAGYHWFNDWGRDSMISLPGLMLSTGRHNEARSVLHTFQSYLSEGMLPNNFPDRGHTPHYNTLDATLWWAWALKKYWQVTADAQFVKQALPALEQVVDWHNKGTRYNIKLDQTDGLIAGGADGVQLTWMDAKVGDYVVTPRRGKAVEIAALWHNFLLTLSELHADTGSDGSRFAEMAKKTAAGFSAFWNAEKGCLFDVINEDGSKDDSVRPNQLIALSLRPELLTAEQAKSALAVVEEELLTPYGLRSLSPKHKDYKGIYGGGKASANQYDRDVTYHQGTVWAWLLGPWVEARLNVLGHTDENFAFVSNHLRTILERHLLAEAGLGSISEIFDGDKPHKPRGCVAQAWSVAELLRVLSDYPQLLK
ncbi:MAG: amylo-alpha-1,6-glucosidase [Candidatus Obscuribacterales bacterium]|nr:amylo-alpha-1,6-glucosidase [Candidatus Obscuribacterales bacterium]